jgi:rhodanese-related sulfurtransferase
MQHLSAPELAQWLADDARPKPLLLDVREPWEFQTCHIQGAMAMPMRTVPARLTEIEAGRPVVCICHHGARSMQVANFLEQNGYTEVINLTGGVHAWALQVDNNMPTY